ncbi:DUF2851 family protein [uncultured Psychroserpens sp.]|uniref:DUF2851 family protein n=1 Tax=uncultured Psychroserpens sp. TaxID=255436 RepID=UPI00261AEFF1|nr:DUF2851 family protein [uncultured Psychroserpens sp.]
MQEAFLHYVWNYKKIDVFDLKTTQHEPLEIISGGRLNSNSGPDFFNGQLRIGNQLWAGNIEIHIKSSDWFVHGHEQDPSYDNVILHVVYEHDTEIFRHDNSIIPTLELKSIINKDLLDNYKTLFSTKNVWINCEKDFADVSNFVMTHWLERLYFERLEHKSEYIEHLLKATKNNWESVLFKLLTKTFGLKVNGDSFLSLANSMDFSVIRKSQSNVLSLEALFFGQSRLLSGNCDHSYYKELQKEYHFLKQKFQLENHGVIPLQFFRLRPLNFPTIRLSQLANLYFKEHHLFSKAMSIDKLSDYYALFEVPTSSFWESHYTFGKETKPLKKIITKSFVDLLLINAILPLKFYHAKQKMESKEDVIVEIIDKIASEKNSIVEGFNALKLVSKSAMTSQALIQLKQNYCNKNKCLKCAIGNSLLSK